MGICFQINSLHNILECPLLWLLRVIGRSDRRALTVQFRVCDVVTVWAHACRRHMKADLVGENDGKPPEKNMPKMHLAAILASWESGFLSYCSYTNSLNQSFKYTHRSRMQDWVPLIILCSLRPHHHHVHPPPGRSRSAERPHRLLGEGGPEMLRLAALPQRQAGSRLQSHAQQEGIHPHRHNFKERKKNTP